MQYLKQQESDIGQSEEAVQVTRYLISQQPLDSHYIQALFTLSQQHSSIHQAIVQHHGRILTSQQLCAPAFLSYMLQLPVHSQTALTFVKAAVAGDLPALSLAMELYLISQFDLLLQAAIHSKGDPGHILLTYLALKVRSFDMDIRLQALSTIKQLGERWQKVPELNGLGRLLPQLIEKEQLVGEVSYTRGLFLHALEDQFCQVRKLAIECMQAFRAYLPADDLRQIVIYMLNDEHEIVRESALGVVGKLEGVMGKQDLQTILMGLREKHTPTRRLIYQILPALELQEKSLVLVVLERSLAALHSYRGDRKAICKMLVGVGRREWMGIGGLVGRVGLPAEEPNWKNSSYKATMLLCHEWWRRGKPGSDSHLPEYFDRHMMYIGDVQGYLLQDELPSSPILQSMVDMEMIRQDSTALMSYLRAEIAVSGEFHRQLLSFALKKCQVGWTQDLGGQVSRLTLKYNLSLQQQYLLQTAQSFSCQAPSLEDLIEFVGACVSNREKWQYKGEAIPHNKCTVSRAQLNTISCTNNPFFISKIVLICEKKPFIGRGNIQMRRLCDLPSSSHGDRIMFHLRMSCYGNVQCKLIEGKYQVILDTYEINDK